MKYMIALSRTFFYTFGRHSAIFIISCLFLVETIWAFDEAVIIPSSGIWVKTQLETTPSYSEAYGSGVDITPRFEGFGKSDPATISLKDFLIRDSNLRDRIDGTVTRQETRAEFDIIYGLAENWLLSANIPFISRQQTSSLSIVSDETISTELEARLQNTIDNLGTKSFQGLGDIRVRAIYVFNRDITSLYHGSFGLKLPTGDTETPIGRYPIEIGDQQYDILSALNFTHYPLIHGLRHNYRFEFTSHWEGTRKTLDGEEGDYLGGNQFDFLYSISYERNNMFWGGEYRHQRGAVSSINGKSQDDAFYANRLHLNVGIGNLSDLEKAPVLLPYEIRVGFETPFLSHKIPASTQWKLIGILYF